MKTDLLVFSEDGSVLLARHSAPSAIAAQLGAIGVEYERWSPAADAPAPVDLPSVLTAYAQPLARHGLRRAFESRDLVSMRPDHPERATIREKFRREHTHADFEVRFFVAGRGTFYLHVADEVFATTCCAGDFISVPADVCHWFDMGSRPDFCSLRLFTTPDGWVGRFTGSDISTRIPDFDALTVGPP